MANEIQLSASATATKGGATVSRSYSVQLTMAGDDMITATQLIGTSAEQIDLGEVGGAPAGVLIKNNDSTNYIEVGGDSGLTVFKIKIVAGGVALFSPSAVPLYAIANTAAVRIEVTAIEA